MARTAPADAADFLAHLCDASITAERNEREGGMSGGLFVLKDAATLVEMKPAMFATEDDFRYLVKVAETAA